MTVEPTDVNEKKGETDNREFEKLDEGAFHGI